MRSKIGIILVVLGLMLTLERSTTYKGFTYSVYLFVKSNWPLLIVLYGLSMQLGPKNKRKQR